MWWAVDQARSREATLELVTVVGGAVGVVGEDAVVADALDAARSHLDEYAAQIRDAGVAVRIRLEAGNPVDVLVDASAGAEMLVLGSDYQGGDEARGFHGIRITAAAECPVVVVPNIDLAGRSGVVVGVDGSETSAAALKFAAGEAARARESMTAVCVWSPLTPPRFGFMGYEESYLANMQATTEETLAIALAGVAADYPDLDVTRVVENGYPSSVINRLASTARLAVVGSHGRGTFRRFLLGSISQEVISRPATATVVVK